MSENKWIEKFLPNAFKRGTTRINTRNHAESFVSVFQRSVLRISALEHFAKVTQLWLIKKHITTETITDNLMAFHPLDYKNIILAEYKKKITKI